MASTLPKTIELEILPSQKIRTYEPLHARYVSRQTILELISNVYRSATKPKNKSKLVSDVVKVGDIAGILKEIIEEHEAVVLSQVIALMNVTVDIIRNGWLNELAIVSADELSKMLSKYNIEAICYDEEYAVMPLPMAKLVMGSDFLKYAIYVKELSDCDDYADTVSMLIDFMLLVNSVGFAGGKIINMNNNEVVGLHAYNILPVFYPDENSIEFWLYEPQLGIHTELDTPIIGNFEYETMFVEFK